jgi:Domain of unknown function (DUF4410)
MKTRAPITVCAIALIAAVGCATTDVTERDTYRGPKLARPDRILVYDFAAAPGDLPTWSQVRGLHHASSTPRTAEEIAAGRELGAGAATHLVARIREMGLPAVRAAAAPAPRNGDIALVGHFESIDEGSALKRVVIGFGSGTAELTTQMEGYLKTEHGMRRLGAGELESGGGGKYPGLVVPIIVTVATANPIGLIVGGAVKAQGELSGRTTIEGTAKRTADAIAAELREAFQKQGWIRNT